MNDLEKQLLELADHRQELVTAASSPEALISNVQQPPQPQDGGSSNSGDQSKGAGRRRLALAGTAILVVVGAAVGLWPSDAPTDIEIISDQTTIPTPTTTAVTEEIADPTPTTTPVLEDTPVNELSGSELAIPSWLEGRRSHSVIWTGTEMIVWGGWTDNIGRNRLANGGAFNPETDSWRMLADPPISARGYHEATWTGSEMLIVGGEENRQDEALSDGAAYDPATDSWRALPEHGVIQRSSEGSQTHSVWTGSLFVVWFSDVNTTKAYDPAANTWNDLPSPDLQPPPEHAESPYWDPDNSVSDGQALHWTGTELVALASYSQFRPMTAQSLSPSTDDAWQQLPSVNFALSGTGSHDPFVTNAAVVDNELIVWSRDGRNGRTLKLEFETRDWKEIETIPIASCEGHPEPLSLGTHVLMSSLCSDDPPVLYDGSTETWQTTTGIGDVSGRGSVWTGQEVITLAQCCFETGGPDVQWEGNRYPLSLVPTGGSLRLPSALDRPRTSADELPSAVIPLRSESPLGEIEMDPDESRLALTAHGVSVWIVPSTDRRNVCWFATSDNQSYDGSCAYFDLPPDLGVGMSLTSKNDGSTYSYGVILNDDIIGVAGGTVEGDVFVHPSVTEPVFLLRDGTTSTARDDLLKDVEITDDQRVVAFCEKFEDMGGVRPESNEGSALDRAGLAAQRLAELVVLELLAPQAIVADVQAHKNYLLSGNVNSLADPDSILIENWPDEVQDAVENIEQYVAETC